MRSILSTLCVSISLLAFTGPVLAQEAEEAKKVQNSPQETFRQLELFGDVFERVRSQYVDEVEDKTLIEYAINGMLTSLDAHSSYLNMDDFKDMRIQTTGEFGGLGIEVTLDNGLIRVVSPIDDTPAYSAGVKAGDYITHLDDKPVIGLSLNEAVEKMRGRVGVPIKLTIRREGTAEPVELEIKRAIIKIQSVRSRLEGDAGYIRVTTFNQHTEDGLKKAIADVIAQKGPALTGIVLDLRNNPGGLLDQAIAVSDAFLDHGEIVSTRGREAHDTKRDNATKGDLARDIPVVVLINGGSASASEIVAGALQDHRRAVVMGTQSFGKGSVQTVIPVQGNAAIRLTTARYYTPSGRSIQAKGIVPDIIVEQARIEKTENTGGIRESDLSRALANPDDVAKQLLEKEKQEGNEVKDEAPRSILPWKGKQEEKKEENSKAKSVEQDAAAADFQLQRALDLLQGLSIAKKSGDVKATPAAKAAVTEAKPTGLQLN